MCDPTHAQNPEKVNWSSPGTLRGGVGGSGGEGISIRDDEKL